MTLYELIDKVSAIVTPDTDALKNYVLHTSDDTGHFLRTQYCFSPEAIANRGIADVDIVIILTNIEFNNMLSKTSGATRLKMRFYYDGSSVEDGCAHDFEVGYPYVYTINLKENTMTMLDRRYPTSD